MRTLFKIVSCSFFVLALLPAPLSAVRDVGATAIIFPRGTIHWSGQPLQVQALAVVRNFGDTTASFPALLRIDDQTAETTHVQELPPLTSDTVEFAITLPESAEHTIACSTALAGDMQTENDRIRDFFRVRSRALGIVEIYQGPGDSVCVGDSLFWGITIHNFWVYSETCPVLFTISSLVSGEVAYADTALIEVAPDDEASVSFGPWIPADEGLFRWLTVFDTLPFIDTASSFIVPVLPVGVEERASPTSPREKLTVAAANPTSGDVRVQLCLPEDQAVCLLVCNASGRVVADLARGPLCPGVHEYSWLTDRFPPGIYFVRLETPDCAEVRKLVLTE